MGKFPGVKRIKEGVYRVNPCPICGHKDHFTLYAPHTRENNNPWWTYSSFNSCCRGGSPVDYLMEFEGKTKDQAIKTLTNKGGDSMDITEFRAKQTPKSTNKKQYDFTDLINKLHKNCISGEGIDYFKQRGFTEELISKYKLGYCSGGYNEALKDYKELYNANPNIKAYKYFIPLFDNNDKCYYIIARADNSINKGPKTMNMKDLGSEIFNERYIQAPGNDYIFVCEGWADALSFEEAGYKAIALNSTQNVKKLITDIKGNLENVQNSFFCICLDNDGAGQSAKKELIDGFKDLNINCEEFKLPEIYKDANEYLQANRGEFKAYTSEYIDSLKNTDFTENYLRDLLDQVEEAKTRKIISTGFMALDKKLGGGLYPGLYCIGAGSSIGKTTFNLQIADNIASTGQDVLFFSLEMSKNEMIAKSLVREMFITDPGALHLPSTRDFLNGQYNIETLGKALKHYELASKHIAIIEGDFNYTVKDIKDRIKSHILRRKTKPVVFIDYLQVITPLDVRMSDKQITDSNMLELKRISREFNIPIICISSINRANYLTSISFESFKESGSIEYTCDVLIGLQLYAINSINQNIKDNKLNEKRDAYNIAKAQNPRDIELVILKNRNGVSTGTHKYIYYPKYNLIEEEGEFEQINGEEIVF